MTENRLKREINYTICPVGNASYIAANRGFLQEGLGKLEITPVRLQTLSQDKWAAHFDYRNDRLFREGGNTPPLWAKSNGTGVVLIGLNLLKQRQAILARADSPITTPDQIRGARIAIPVHPNALIDFHKASAEQAFELLLAARGISKKDVTFVEIVDEADFLISGNTKSKKVKEVSAEVEALDAGEVDVIFVKLSIIQKLLDTGKYKVVYDLAANREQLSPVNNEYPNTLTVSKKLAEEEPETVVAFVKQILLAAEWAAVHRLEAESLLAEQTYGTLWQYKNSYDKDFYKHLAPDLSGESLRALESRARFLYDQGYLNASVDVYEWANDYFLKTAIKEIERERSNR